MQYQIIAKDEDNTRFVLYILDDLELARKKFDFTVKVASGPDDILMSLPSWKSIELQRVESICFSDIDNETSSCEKD
jgi:hypothetical protein